METDAARLPPRVAGRYSPDARYASVVVNITNHCNLRCAHCFVYRDGNPNQTPASIRDEPAAGEITATLRALRDRHGIRHALWMGGEPLLRPEVLESGLSIFSGNTITTNGTIPLRDFGPRVLYVVSLDGPEAQNDAVRGRGVYTRVMRNLSRLPADLRSPVQVQCTVTRRNQAHLEALVRALQGTRIGWMTFSFYVPRRDDRGQDAWTDNAQRETAVREVMRLREAYPGFVRNSQPALELMLARNAPEVTRDCPAQRQVLPLYLEGDHFRAPFCCYGNDVDCDRCGAWVVFHLAAQERGGGSPFRPGRASPAGPRDRSW